MENAKKSFIDLVENFDGAPVLVREFTETEEVLRELVDEILSLIEENSARSEICKVYEEHAVAELEESIEDLFSLVRIAYANELQGSENLV